MKTILAFIALFLAVAAIEIVVQVAFTWLFKPRRVSKSHHYTP